MQVLYSTYDTWIYVVATIAEVKSLSVSSANALGFYDMSGNVWEICFTEYDRAIRRKQA